jgi:putative transposase
MLKDRLDVSERRACQIAGQHRSTQRREPCVAADDAALRAALRKVSEERPRWGYRRAHARLLEEGWSLNRKRTQRLWREEGLRVPVRRRKRQRLGESTVPAARLRAEHPDHVWALDFQFDQTADGQILKLLHVVDEFTREALAIECRRRIDADATVATLDRLIAARGQAPEHIRCDNGPELTANALRDWCRFSGAGSAYIDPGSPWQNPYVESFGSRVRDELLGVELFSSLAEAKVMVEDWREDYNERRPHSALGMSAPGRFARSWRKDRENGQPITLGDPAQALRAAQNAPISIPLEPIEPDHGPGGDQAALAISLRSPSGLPPRDGDTTLHLEDHHQLPQRADERGPAILPC